jgi:hypothetical protein
MHTSFNKNVNAKEYDEMEKYQKDGCKFTGFGFGFGFEGSV